MSEEQSLILYAITFLIAALFLSLSQKYKSRKVLKNSFFFIASGVSIMMLGCRYYVGTDYENYLLMYERYKGIPLIEVFSVSNEFLNVIICKIIYMLYDNKYIFIIVYAALTIIIVYRAILKLDSRNTFLITFMFSCLFFPHMANAVRQTLAVVIIFYAYTVLQHNLSKFFVLCIVASCIHFSSLIVLPAGIMYSIIKDVKIRNCAIIVFYIIFVIISYLGVDVFSSNVFMQKFLGYLEGANETLDIGLGVLFLNLPILLISIFCYKKVDKTNVDYIFCIILFVVGIIMAYLGYLNIYLNRFALYFSIVQIILIPKALEIFKDNMTRKILVLVVVLVMWSQFINNYYETGNAEIFPYQYIEKDFLKEGSL